MNTPPRYTTSPFPRYRYLPFVAGIPHPRRDPDGHSYGQEDEYLPHFDASAWQTCEPYLYGVDLFNSGYWWEAHEAWETVWLAAGPETPTGQFVQGLIQIAAAQLKRVTKERRGAVQLTASGIGKLSGGGEQFLGIDVAELRGAAQRCLEEDAGEFPQILLAGVDME
jgi:predicted metal-dependent hydrolase